MSTATIELSSTRQKLFEALGDTQGAYIAHMKQWFRKKSTKEEFDQAARKLLSKEVVYLHNQFLLAILNKCQTLVNLTPGPSLVKSENLINFNQELLSPSKFDPAGDRLKKGKIKRKVKPNKPQLEHKFQPVNTGLCAPEATSMSMPGGQEKELQFCSKEKTLPDISLIHGRLLVAAWEEGLEGVEDDAVSLTLAAVEQQLRRLISSLVMSRNSWREYNGVRHSSGAGAPDPWLLNTQTKRKKLRCKDGAAALQTTIENTVCLAPVDRQQVDDAEAEGLYNVALASKRRHSHALDLFDLMSVLKRDRGMIPSHSVYSINMERIIMKLHHKT